MSYRFIKNKNKGLVAYFPGVWGGGLADNPALNLCHFTRADLFDLFSLDLEPNPIFFLRSLIQTEICRTCQVKMIQKGNKFLSSSWYLHLILR